LGKKIRRQELRRLPIRLGQPDQIGRFHQAQVADDDINADLFRGLLEKSAFADAGRAKKHNGGNDFV